MTEPAPLPPSTPPGRRAGGSPTRASTSTLRAWEELVDVAETLAKESGGASIDRADVASELYAVLTSPDWTAEEVALPKSSAADLPTTDPDSRDGGGGSASLVDQLLTRRIARALSQAIRAAGVDPPRLRVAIEGNPNEGALSTGLSEVRVRSTPRAPLEPTQAAEPPGVDDALDEDSVPSEFLIDAPTRSADELADPLSSTFETLPFDGPRSVIIVREPRTPSDPPAHTWSLPATEALAELARSARRHSNEARRDRGPSNDGLIGRTLKNKYRVLRRLGHGGAGAVYEAEDRQIGARVAIKVLHPDSGRRRESVARFLEEARLLTALDHENIVRWITFDETEEGQPYFVMEYLDGRELSELLRGLDEPLEWKRAAHLGVQILRALERAHGDDTAADAATLLHLDLKPQNVFVLGAPQERGGERVKVIDFGIAQRVGSDEESHARGGTPLYASPEQSGHLLADPDTPPLDGRSDLYSFGVLLFQALTGELPLDPDRPPREMLRAHRSETPKRARSVVPSVPKPLDEFVDRCLRKQPEQRWKSASEARRALERIVSPPKRGLLVALVILLLAAATTAVIMATRRPPFPLAIAQEDVVLFGQSQPSRGAPASLPIAVGSDEWSVALETSELRWPTDGVTVEAIDPADDALLPIEATYPRPGTIVLRSTARSAPTERDWFQLRVRRNGSERRSQSYRLHWLAPPSTQAVGNWIDRWTFKTLAAEPTPTREVWPPEAGVRVPPAGVPTWRRAEVQLDGVPVAAIDLTDAAPRDLSLSSYLEAQPLGRAPRSATWTVTVENLVGQRTTATRDARLAPVRLAVTGPSGEPHAGFIATRAETENPATVRPRRLGVIVSPGGAELWAHLNRPGQLRIHVDGLATGEGREVVVRAGDGELRAPIDSIFPGLADGAYEWSIQPVDEYRLGAAGGATTVRGSFEWRTRVPRLDLLTDEGVITPGVPARRSRAVGEVAVQFGGLARRVVFDARYTRPDGESEEVAGLVLEPGADPVVLPFRVESEGEHQIVLEVRNDARDPQPFEVAEYTIAIDDRPPTITWPRLRSGVRRADDGTPIVRGDEFQSWTIEIDDDGGPVTELAVEINGRAIPVFPRGTSWPLRTWIDASAPDGLQALRVRATDAFGNTTEESTTFYLSRREPVLEDRTGAGAWPMQSVAGEESWVRRWAFAVSTPDRDVMRVTAYLTVPSIDPDEAPLVVTLPLEERDGLFRPSRAPGSSSANVPPGWAGREVMVRFEAVDRGGNTTQLIRTRRIAGRDALPLPTWFAVGDRTLVRIDPRAGSGAIGGYEFGGRRREQEFPHLNYVVAPDRLESYYLATQPEPEAGLSWAEAAARARSLGGRLPSWLEWEFAIRGGERYWPQYRESVLLGPDGRSLATTAEWTRSPWVEGTPRERRQSEALERMAFGEVPPSNRAVVVRDAFDRFEPIAIGATTTHDNRPIGFRLTLGLNELDRSLERAWGLR